MVLDFIFETQQKFFVEVIDIDDAANNKYDLIGTAEFTMAELMGARA